jgi:hypothetical protein
MYVKKATKDVENHNIYSKVKSTYNLILYTVFFFPFHLYNLEHDTCFVILLICSKVSHTSFGRPNSFILEHNLTISFRKVCTYILK